jgi:hypothetical protein
MMVVMSQPPQPILWITRLGLGQSFSVVITLARAAQFNALAALLRKNNTGGRSCSTGATCV